MRLLNRYVLREWFSALLCSHLVITCLLLLEDVYKNFAYCLKAKASLVEVVKYYAVLATSFHALVTPIAMFVATLFVLGQLHKRNEITAMKCSGMNILTIAKPIIAGGIILAVLNLIAEALLVPMAIDYTTAFRIQIDARAGYNTEESKIGFYNHLDNRIWFFQRLDKLSCIGKEITVICCDEENREKLRIFATLANFSPTEKCWHFTNCNVTTLDPLTGVAIKSESFAEKDFPLLTEDPRTMIASVKKRNNLSFPETVNLLKYGGKGGVVNGFRVKIHKTFANAANCLIILFFAISFATIGTRIEQFGTLVKALGLLVLFFSVETIFATLGSGGALSPAIAAWGPGVLMLLPVARLFRTAM
ncbi:MAG: LptF/LptG family permease [Puniceicoccales bacterium]|jgi:lipopolysaccharide export system permease protein|nr:LptF/LptG family permease [Puniceicoccales bacterium]